MSEPPADALARLEADPPVTVLGDGTPLPAPAPGEIRARIPGERITDDASLFSAIAAELSFPSWFGANWDALLDCLRDLGSEGRPPSGVIVVVDDAGAMLASAPRTGALLLETWVSAALWWARRGVPLRLYLVL